MICASTSRLRLRPLRVEDTDAVYGFMGNDPAMTWDRSSRDRERVSKDLQKRLDHYREHGFGVLAIEEIASGKIIGQCGLQQSPIGGIELVAYTARTEWHRGFARESSQAALEIAFRRLNVDEVLAIVRKDNISAQRLAEWLGFRWRQETHLYDQEVVVGGLARDDWKSPSDLAITLWTCEPSVQSSSPTRNEHI